MIADEAKARALAHEILRSVRSFASAGGLAPDAPAVAEGRQIFRDQVSPELHGVFEQALASPLPPEAKGRSDWRTTVIGIGFVAVLAGTAFLAQTYVLGPGRESHLAILDGWIARARLGGASPPSSLGSTTDAALRALASSQSHRILRDYGAYGFSPGSGVTCFELELSRADGVTRLAIRIADEPSPPHVTHAGLQPPCDCGRNGRITGCAP